MQIKNLFQSRKALLYIISISIVFSFSAWNSLLNNFVVEMANFDGSKIGILQSLREIPGFLAFSVVLVTLLIAQQRLAYISMLFLGVGTAATGFFPNVWGLYITTFIMSLGFHYLETLNQSLSLQWLKKSEAPIVLGKISAITSFTGLFSIISIYIMMKFLNFEYKSIYLIFGGLTVFTALICWFGFEHFKDDIVQEKKLQLKKEYWLFYLLTFLAGARRQIFMVFAGFLLVEKFGVKIHDMMLLFIINAILNMYIAPKVGKFISVFGERRTFMIEYFGLIIIFATYAFVENVYLAFTLYILDHLLFAMGIARKTYFQKIANPQDIATASAVSFTINHIAAVFLPFVLGLVWLYSHSLVFLIGTLIACLSFILSFLVPLHPQRGYETTLKGKV